MMFLLLSAGCMLAQPAQKLVRSGNKAYKDGHFKEAEIDYRKALTKAPNSQKATFNLGNSLYKQQNYDQAAAQYLKVAQSGTKEAHKANTFYNLGNTLLQSKKYKESIDAYKMALRDDPKDEDTRYNLAYAMVELTERSKATAGYKAPTKRAKKARAATAKTAAAQAQHVETGCRPHAQRHE